MDGGHRWDLRSVSTEVIHVRMLIHAGAGNLSRDSDLGRLEPQMLEGLRHALRTGHDILRVGGSSLDAVTEAVACLEDNPLYNAGRGSVLTREGRVEMDAAIMDGRGPRAGAVACVGTIRNPVRAARSVMEHSPHVLLVGTGAEAFARDHGCTLVSPHHFVTPEMYAYWSSLAPSEDPRLEVSAGGTASKRGTVGAVALDQQGNVAVATSTGGLTRKMPGRVGDSPIPGAGTYACNRSVAVSFTGSGEHLMRSVAGHRLAALVEQRGLSLAEAVTVLLGELTAAGADVGLIALSPQGGWCIDFNTTAMLRGVVDAAGTITSAMFIDGPVRRQAG